jgi:hypothetical protein
VAWQLERTQSEAQRLGRRNTDLHERVQSSEHAMAMVQSRSMRESMAQPQVGGRVGRCVF